MAQQTEHLDLSEYQQGASAEIKPVTWGIARRAAKAGEQGGIEFLYTALRSLVHEWHVLDGDGKPVPHPKDLTDEQLDDLDVHVGLIPAIGRAVGARIREAFGGTEPPNSDGGSPKS